MTVTNVQGQMTKVQGRGVYLVDKPASLWRDVARRLVAGEALDFGQKALMAADEVAKALDIGHSVTRSHCSS